MNARVKDFLKWWAGKVEKGEASPLDRLEIMAVEFFVQYEEDRKQKPSPPQPQTIRHGVVIE